MIVLYLLPVVLSALLLGAHFLRMGIMPLVALAVVLPFFLLIRRAWAARWVQIVLALGTLEWIRTLFLLAAARWAGGQPWLRLAVILGAVAVFTAGSALLFSWNRKIRKWYGLDRSSAVSGDQTLL